MLHLGEILSHKLYDYDVTIYNRNISCLSGIVQHAIFGEPADDVKQIHNLNEFAAAENVQRMKRNEQKKEINLPQGYSIYEIPKLPDKSPMPIFLHLNVSKILTWDELNEV